MTRPMYDILWGATIYTTTTDGQPRHNSIGRSLHMITYAVQNAFNILAISYHRIQAVTSTMHTISGSWILLLDTLLHPTHIATHGRAAVIIPLASKCIHVKTPSIER